MKNIIVFFVFVSLPFTGGSYTWQNFCPDSIHATNICFGVGSSKGVICSPEGMYLWEEDIEQWSFYTYGLPVTGAAWFDDNKILVAMGDGTWSDGIYTFDLSSHQFEVVEWIVKPNFIMIIPVLDKVTKKFTDEYFVGSLYGGLYRSVDGLTWTGVPYFDGKGCKAMDFYGEHLVISETESDINIHWSDDYGVNWYEASSATWITDLKFYSNGVLYGVFPNYSNSSGLYKSVDFGNNWDVEFWSDMMSAVGFDAVGNIFVGWESPAGGNEGIAIYNPMAPPPGLTFLNNGLTSTSINKILLNPVLSSITIFCCTDAGVYMCNDYLVGENETQAETSNISIYPNPVRDQTTIHINLPEKSGTDFSITVLNYFGIKVDEIKFENTSSPNQIISWNEGMLSAGVYSLVVRTKHETIAEKFIIL